MSQTQPEEVDWKVLLGQLLIVKQTIHDRDPESATRYTLPRVKATEEEVAALEDRVGERFDEHYRNFLLHANGWPKVYFDMGLFGIPEFTGEGDWQVANQQLSFYEQEGVLAESGLEAGGVMPIAAGEGMIDLIVIVRPGWKDAGTVVWFDGGEFDRWPNFSEYFASIIAGEQQHADKLAAPKPEP